MKSSVRLKLRLLGCLAGVVLLGGLAAALTFGFAWNRLYARHERAEQLWKLRKPTHYIYKIELRSSFWVNHFQIEIRNNLIKGVIDLNTGEPALMGDIAPGSYLHTTNAVWDFLVIDRIFWHIQAAAHRPRSLKALLSRTNPNLYTALAMRGVVEYGWPGCDPAYPKVSYDKTLGFPKELQLYGQPCSTVLELNTPISLTISDFTILP